MAIGALLGSVISRNRNVILVTASGTGSTTTPAGCSKVTMECIGGGGNGFASNTSGNRAGGGGGRYAISDADIAVTGGSTVVYYSVGAAVNQSWVRAGTNSAPASSTDGCLAKQGTSAASATAGVGTTAGSVGATTRNGGTGGLTGSAVGGGAAGKDAAGSGQTAGGNSPSISASLMGGGTGGAYQNVGTEPGGGGAAATAAGGTKAGAIGRARILFSL